MAIAFVGLRILKNEFVKVNRPERINITFFVGIINVEKRSGINLSVTIKLVYLPSSSQGFDILRIAFKI